ncbi:uncharacterized protein BT62DRAFT_1076394 [Guyanagaster necrorhizus]|uniref:Uncharacterized protein n=1 Tax=Guyanagaster necrorhizus TaxID=856835 RepID=A0A9P7VSU2_9AGAR|nr:uncharacterized protein BT62DRAFT_1076394 [Guyanagaster necrorhizus MCA 3950]KAG7445988.1 hypothetical protein BT62DRAFT_1076394 [Guyanagaster necrorhizus MCA 3950]
MKCGSSFPTCLGSGQIRTVYSGPSQLKVLSDPTPLHYSDLSTPEAARGRNVTIRSLLAKGDYLAAEKVISRFTHAASRLEQPQQNNILNSARRPISTLIHAYVRAEMPQHAARHVCVILDRKGPLKTRTLVAVINSLLSSVSEEVGEKDPKRHFFASYVLSLQSERVTDPYLRNAMELWIKVEKARLPAARETFQGLLTALIAQEECVSAGAVFSRVSRRHWEYMAMRDMHYHPRDVTMTNQRFPINPAEAPAYPYPQLFENVVSLCMSVLRRTEATRGQQQIRRSAGHGLIFLASLLHHRQIPFPEVGSLISALFYCMLLPDSLWVPENPFGGALHSFQRQTLRLGQYSHGVIKSLARRLPNRSPPTAYRSQRYSILPVLSYNSYRDLLMGLIESFHDPVLTLEVWESAVEQHKGSQDSEEFAKNFMDGFPEEGVFRERFDKILRRWRRSLGRKVVIPIFTQEGETRMNELMEVLAQAVAGEKTKTKNAEMPTIPPPES